MRIKGVLVANDSFVEVCIKAFKQLLDSIINIFCTQALVYIFWFSLKQQVDFFLYSEKAGT